MNRGYLRAWIAAMVIFAGALSLSSHTARAQSMNELLEQLGVQQLARDYVRPAVDAVGYSIKSGYVHSARVDTAFHIWVGIKGMATFIPDQDREYTAKLPDYLVAAGYPAELTTATIVGGNGALLQSSNTGEPDIQLPGGTGMQRSYMLMPQVSIGPLLGTDIILRGLPAVTFHTDMGDVFFYGAALKHEITHFFEFPVDIAVVAGFQRFGLTDYIKGSSMNGMLLVGEDYGIVSFFGGIGYESYNIEVGYNPVDGTYHPEAISLEFKRRNLRFTAGGAVRILPPLSLTGEYSFGEMNNLTVGLGISL